MSRSIALSLAVALLLAGCPQPGPDDDDSAVVVDDDDATEGLPDTPFAVEVHVLEHGQPMVGATVLQGGSTQHSTTDVEGEAVLVIDPTIEGQVWVIAAAEDHRSAGEQLRVVPEGPIVLELVQVEVDNPAYEFQPAGVDEGASTQWCSHCHVTFVQQFGTSAHFESARDEQVHDLYTGTAAALDSQTACEDGGGEWRPGVVPGSSEVADRCYLGRGLLPDSTDACGAPGQLSCDDPALPLADRPTVTGGCADCHAPAIGGPADSGHSLLAAAGIAFDEGVTCDVCHKVRGVDLTADAGGLGGRLQLGRPLEAGSAASAWRPVMYAPYPDVINGGMGGAWAPVFGTADLCSGCHEHRQAPLWDDPALALDLTRWPDGVLPVLSTWSEWSESVVSPGSPCKDCHMPPLQLANSADIEIFELEPGAVAGFIREEGQVRDHSFYGPLDEREMGGRLIDTAAGVLLEGAIEGGELVVDVGVTNLQTGHGLPTGKALRRVLVLVEARCDGEPMAQTGGRTVTELGGALAIGVVGEQVTAAGATLSWTDLPDGLDADGLVVRAVRPTGDWMEYQGPGPFRDPAWTAADKGLPETEPLGEVDVASLASGEVELSAELALTGGDVLFLAEAAGLPTEGGPSLALAGAPGMDFGKVLADADGNHQVPHYRAVDIVRDNRLLPYESATSEHRFELPDGCADLAASARVIYRRYPLRLARERGWELLDHVITSADVDIQP
jgi:hypothetical protein